MDTSPQKHDILWLEDGNVVLATDTLLFRVHKTVLALHSTVLKDMFELPLGLHGGNESTGDAGVLEDGTYRSDTFEGLPVVQMHGEKGNDVAHLLLAIYERGYYDREDDTTPLENVIALLTLSAKYDVATIRADVLKQLSRNYPTTLAQYREVDLNASGKELEPILFGRSRRDCHVPLLRAASTTSRSQSEIRIIIPSLYFACASIMHLREYRDDALTLDVPTMSALFHGEFELAFLHRHSLSSVISCTSPPTGCPNNSGLEQCKTSLRSPHTGEMTWLSALCWFHVANGDSFMSNFFEKRCQKCRECIIQVLEETKSLLWDAIPCAFGFESWDVVRGTT